MVHRELTVAGLLGIPVPEEVMTDWGRMGDELNDQDLATETAADLALTSGIRRKRPDAIAVHWGRRMVRILEFSRVNDFREDWCETVERHKPAGISR